MLPWIIGILAFIIGGGAAAAVVWIMLNNRLAAAIARTQSLDEHNARLNEELNAARKIGACPVMNGAATERSGTFREA